MSQNTLKVNELHDDADFDENGTEAESFDEKALVEEEASENDLAEKSCCLKALPNVYWMRRSSIWVRSVIRLCLPQRKKSILRGVLCAVTCRPAAA
ncbi:Uncharacterised protein [Serratia entomophila]|nr:Uncharacterised protein [Serratia entomophila]